MNFNELIEKAWNEHASHSEEVATRLEPGFLLIEQSVHEGVNGRVARQGSTALVFDTIEERTKHLQTFLAGYAELARLPAPRRAHVAWAPVLARLREAWPRVTLEGVPEGTGWIDEGQVEQLLVNLVKNAGEARPDGEVAAGVQRADGGFEVTVRDRGPGMSEEVLKNALLPFYSTKERGTGLGLALCREIVEAHGGRVGVASEPE